MKQTALFLLLLLSLFVSGWADTLVQCPAGQPNCSVGPNVAKSQTPSVVAPNPLVSSQAAVVAMNSAPKRTYALPTLQEFYYPLQPVFTPVGALFGSKKRQEQEMIEYWQTRREQLDSENQACTVLSDDASIKECLQNVRQVENNKTAAIRSINEQRVAQQFSRYMYYQQAAQQINSQSNYNRPLNVDCHTYGTTTNCSSY